MEDQPVAEVELELQTQQGGWARAAAQDAAPAVETRHADRFAPAECLDIQSTATESPQYQTPFALAFLSSLFGSVCLDVLIQVPERAENPHVVFVVRPQL